VRDYASGDDVTIELDPALDPERNIRRYFKRAKKGEKGLAVIKGRRVRIRRHITELEKEIARIESTDNPAELASMIAPASSFHGPGGKRRSGRPRFRSFAVDGTHTILVGRSDRENDELTHRYAAPTDLWFHAQGSPGSHVILRGAGRSTPSRIIEMAAEAAAWFSKARSSGTVPVICAEKRHVRRPRGASPGTAVCQRSKTLFVTPKLPRGDGEET
jgi:predicted ribosome quality control (RQC) complex YloA/Tae2 family protein